MEIDMKNSCNINLIKWDDFLISIKISMGSGGILFLSLSPGALF